VRSVAFSHSALPVKTGDEAVLQAFHLLNNFDIPKGAAREKEKDAHGNIVAEHTIWTSANDLKAKRFYIRTYQNSQIRMLDLMKMNLEAQDITKFSIKGDEFIKSLNP
jgi:choloylglycine hydrolase